MQLVSKLGFDGTKKVLQMFSYGNKAVEVNGGAELYARIRDALGVNGNGTKKLVQLFEVIRGNETELLQMVHGIGKYLCGNSIDSPNWL